MTDREMLDALLNYVEINHVNISTKGNKNIFSVIDELKRRVTKAEANLVYYSDRKIVLIDFDGVIHSYVSGWLGETNILDKPLPGAIEGLEALCRTPLLDVRIWSNRCNSPAAITAMRAWLVYWGMDPELVEHKLTFEPGKPKAHIIIDDRACQFTGSWQSPTPHRVLKFEPWYYDHPAYKRK